MRAGAIVSPRIASAQRQFCMVSRRAPIRWIRQCLILFPAAASAYSQDPQAAARALIPPGTKFSDALLDSVEQEVQTAIARIPRATTKLEVENARQPLRKRLENSLGLHRLT